MPLELHEIGPTTKVFWRRKTLEAVICLFCRVGAERMIEKRKGTAYASILMYHSIPVPWHEPWIDPANTVSVDVFEKQMRFLSRHRHPISLDELVKTLNRGTGLAKGTVAVTFDDGYLDNLEVAAPILARYRIPAIIYLPTAYIDGGINQWADMLYSYFRARSRQFLHLSKASPRPWHLERPDQMRRAYFALSETLLSLEFQARETLLAEIIDQLEPTKLPPRLMMTWDDVRTLIRRYPNTTIGLHTVNNVDLTICKNLPAKEISPAVKRIKDEIGYQPLHFSFLYSRSHSDLSAIIRRAGFRSAVTSGPLPVVYLSSDPYSLSRIAGPNDLIRLEAWTSSTYAIFAKLLKKYLNVLFRK